MNRIFKKLALRISVLFLIIVALASIFSAIFLNNAYKTETRDKLFNSTRTIENVLITGGELDILRGMDSAEDMRITLIDSSGVVLFDTRAEAATLDNHGKRPEIIEALEDGTGFDIRHSNTLGADMMYAALRSDHLSMVIRVALMHEGVAAYSAALWIPLITLLIVAFMLCLGIVLFVSRSVTQPIIQLRDETERIAEGSYDGLEIIKTGDEIEELSTALCSMAGKLKRNIEAITENSSRLEAVFRAVPGGIVAVDNGMRVIMANPAARRMFAMPKAPEGRHFLEATQHTQLEEVIREAAASNGIVEKELRVMRGMGTVILQVFAVSVFSKGHAYGVILLVQDISTLRKLEAMRSDFAANVTHELKTPLTVIRGFIDTLKEPDITPEDANRFVDIIALESERLSRLIDDVLLLSEIESSSSVPSPVTDMREAVGEAANMLKGKAKDKNIEFIVKLDDAPVLVMAEPDRIRQMAINLIDNAIKYTTAGYVRISVSAEDNGRGILCVEDTGIGIPQQNLPRLFERFYRVDKSRSRALGGTGLGLAIVKHIVSLLGGHITVESTPGKGSLFTVILPGVKQPVR